MNTLVIFHSHDEHGEKLALDLALGAVQAKCDIRLRRLGAPEPEETIHQGYIAPRKQDLEWADAVVLAIAPRNFGIRKEVAELLAQLSAHCGDHP